MKKIFLSAVLMLLSMVPALAQATTKLNEFNNTWVKPLFPIVAAIVFIAGALMNMGKFFGEHRDIKGGITNIFIYLGVLFVIAAIYTGIMSMAL
jgi:hypothetical protein